MDLFDVSSSHPSSDPFLAAAIERGNTQQTDNDAHALVGAYAWRGTRGSLLDFEQVTLEADGTYTARVEATLLNPGVRSFGASCMLPEHGVWNAFKVKGATKLRVCPTTGRARVYGVTSLGSNELTLSRRGSSTTLDAVLASH